MFEVGDKVVHPSHGAGIIAGIEKPASLEGFGRYYVINLASGERRVMVPVERADSLGLRRAIDKRIVPKVYAALSSQPDELPNNFTQRQTGLTNELKSGDVLRVAEMVRNLFWRSQRKRLSASDQELYLRAKEMLAGELALTQGVEVSEAVSRIESELHTAPERKKAGDGASRPARK